MTIGPPARAFHLLVLLRKWMSFPRNRTVPGHFLRDVGDHKGRVRCCQVGNTPLPVAMPRRSSVHPRPRGEHLWNTYAPYAYTGSSPPARGTPLEYLCPLRVYRFIPARAGNTSGIPMPLTRIPVHPRPRGEHLAAPRTLASEYGSSPPARGTLIRRGAHHAIIRFIPARAGNTRSLVTVSTATTVHPRPRGEHGIWLTVSKAADGSSPPARG